jgi:aminoglycoside 2'-N-acetyltransferase I
VSDATGGATARSPEEPGPDPPVIRLVPSDALRPDEVVALRELFDEAWSDDAGGFTDRDWSHAVGGVHVIAEADGRVVAHASVVQRELHTAGQRLRTGYVEAVATRPSHQREGLGSLVIGEVGELIDRTYRLGALATGVSGFYERLGWVVWEGPTSVRTAAGLVRTAEEDGNVLVRLTPTSPELDLSAPISCDWRPGDVW